MFNKTLVLFIFIAFQVQAKIGDEKPVGMATESWDNLRSAAHELVISSNDSSSSLMQVVSLNDGWAFVGAENDNIYGAGSGAVHVFKYVNGQWIKHSKIIPHDGQAGDKFGSSISVAKDANTVAIGAKGVDSTNFYSQGAVYVYSLTSQSWEYKTRLRPQGPAQDIGFGSSLSQDELSLIVGAPSDNGGVNGSGAAYIYSRSGPSSWVLSEKLDAGETNDNAQFGRSVSIDGNRAIVGAQYGLNGNGSATGYVVSYLKTAGVWNQEEMIFGTFPGDLFGRSVSISGNNFIVSEQGADQAHIYDRFIGSWRKLSTLTVSNANELTVKIVGNRAIIGDGTYDNGGLSNNGAVHVYDFDGLVTWSLTDTLTSNDPQNNALVGGRVDFFEDKIIASTNINAAYAFGLSSSWSQSKKMTPNDAMTNDKFGYSVSISGNYAVVGAYGNDDFGSESGAAYVFKLINDQWINTGKLVPNDGQAGDRFGYSVSIDNNFALIGAYQDDDMGNNAGAAYLFYREPEGNWLQATKLYSDDAVANDNFGKSVSLDSYTLKAVVGAEFVDIGASNSVGAVYVFGYNSVTSWPQEQKLVANDAAAFSNFGNAVSIDYNTILIGSESDDSNGFGAGSAYVYEYNNSSWTQAIKLLPNDILANDGFGSAVSVDNDQLIVGARNDGTGSAYIYEKNNNTWSQHTKILPQFSGSNDDFGLSVAIKGSDVFVGSTFRDFNGTDSGSVYQFAKTNDLWWQIDEFISSNTDISDNFGRSVSLSNDHVLIGAEDTPTGEAYIFYTSQNPTAVHYGLHTDEDTPIVDYNVINDATDPDGGNNRIISVTQPLNGSVLFTTEEINYYPDSNYCNDSMPTDDFTYMLNGGSVGIITVNVNCVDDLATAVNDNLTVQEDEASYIDAHVHDNDSDIDGGSMVVSVTQPAHGESHFVNNVVLYRPHPDYCNDGITTDDFNYNLTGGASATVFVTVNCVGGDPVTNNDIHTVDEDSGVSTFTVLSNDVEDGVPLQITSVTQPTNGTVTFAPNVVSYTPNPEYCNDGNTIDGFNYTANHQFVASVSVTVNCIDDDPIAVADSFTINEDNATDLAVYANDTDIDNGPISAHTFTHPANGDVVKISTGFRYTPDENYCNTAQATDDFTYKFESSPSVTVSIRVNCIYDPAVAHDDMYVVEEDNTIVITPLNNDEQNDSSALTLTFDTQPLDGTLTTNAGIITYTPNSNYCNDGVGTDNFQYHTNDSATAMISITVNCVDDLPVAVNDNFTIDEDIFGTFAKSTLLSNDDFDGGNNDVISITQPSHGETQLHSNEVVYYPDDNYCTSNGGNDDTFTYTANGGTSATVSVAINCVDDLPNGVEDSFTIQEDTINILDVLANDTDIDDGPIEIVSIFEQPAHGTITNNGNNLTYQPEFNHCHSDANGKETFFYTNNGNGLTLVSIHIECVDDPVQAIDDFATVEEDTSIVVNLVVNDLDPEATEIIYQTIESFTQPANGTVVFATNDHERILYTPNQNYCNNGITLDTFMYTLTNQLSANVSLTVDCVNDQPSFESLGNQVVSEQDSFTINEWAYNFDFGANDENNTQSVEAFNVQITSDSNALLSSVVVDNNGNLTFQTTANFGTAIVEISLKDDGGVSNNGIDTSVVHSLTITKVDGIFGNGFEDPQGFALLDIIDGIKINLNEGNIPVYHFELDSILYFHQEFILNNDYGSHELIDQFNSWYDEIKRYNSFKE